MRRPPRASGRNELMNGEMALWIVFALMTAAAITAVVWPLARKPRTGAAGSELVVYKDQLDEIERDRGAGRGGAAVLAPPRRRARGFDRAVALTRRALRGARLAECSGPAGLRPQQPAAGARIHRHPDRAGRGAAPAQSQ